MVVALVGFAGGWSKELFGPEMLPLAGAAAFIALFRYKTGIVQVIGVCAAIGLGYSLLL